MCGSETAQCEAVGTRSEGWYASRGAGCGGQRLIEYAFCGSDGGVPDAGPEPDAAGLEDASADATVADAGGAGAPECRYLGTRSEGWYRADGSRICFAFCARNTAGCDNIGTRSEGWYASSGQGCGGGPLIEYAFCSMGTDAGASTADASPGDAAPSDAGLADTGQHAGPECRYVGTRSEGWYRPSTGARVCWAQCRGTTSGCQFVGTRSEGWYARNTAQGCGMASGLIEYAMCGP